MGIFGCSWLPPSSDSGSPEKAYGLKSYKAYKVYLLDGSSLVFSMYPRHRSGYGLVSVRGRLLHIRSLFYCSENVVPCVVVPGFP